MYLSRDTYYYYYYYYYYYLCTIFYLCSCCHFSRFIWSALANFSISTQHTAFPCFSSFTFTGQRVSPLYTLPQQHRMEYMQFLVTLYSVEGSTRRDIFKEFNHSWILSWFYIDYIFFKYFRLGFWHLALWDEVKEKNMEEHWKIRYLKETA